MKNILIALFYFISLTSNILAQQNAPLLKNEANKYLSEIIADNKFRNGYHKEIIIFEKKLIDDIEVYRFKFRRNISIINNTMSNLGDFEGYPLIYSSNDKNARIDSNHLHELKNSIDKKIEYGQTWLDNQPKYIEDKDKNGKIVKIPINYEGDFVKGGDYVLKLKDGKRIDSYQEQ